VDPQSTLELRNLPDRLADHLVIMIAKGQLKPGQRIFEKEICEIQGVSRIPVREALRLLQAQGVVRSEPNRGTYVTAFSSEETLELLQLRLAVERIALRRIQERGIPRGHIKSQFAEVTEAMRRAATLRDRLAFCQAHLAFHHRIIDIAQSLVLAPTWQLLSRGVFILLMQEAAAFIDFDGFIVEHEQLLEMLLSGRKEELDRVIESHILWDNVSLRDAECRVDGVTLEGAALAGPPHALAAKLP
jgi:DNA-binding GntR family transcriptional regulator